jgi:hypothetical protein
MLRRFTIFGPQIYTDYMGNIYANLCRLCDIIFIHRFAQIRTDYRDKICVVCVT